MNGPQMKSNDLLLISPLDLVCAQLVALWKKGDSPAGCRLVTKLSAQSMNILHFLTLIMVLLSSTVFAGGPIILPLERVCKTADLVVIADVSQPRGVPGDGSTPDPGDSRWTQQGLSQCADLSNVTRLLGKAPDKITLYGGHVAALSEHRIESGRFLLLLTELENGAYRAVDWNYSFMRVKDKQVEWISDYFHPDKIEPISPKEALKRISAFRSVRHPILMSLEAACKQANMVIIADVSQPRKVPEGGVDPFNPKYSKWNDFGFSHCADFSKVTTLIGKATHKLTLYGGMYEGGTDYRIEAGRYLLLLTEVEGGAYRAVDWNYSFMRVKNKQVEWIADYLHPGKLDLISADEAVKRISALRNRSEGKKSIKPSVEPKDLRLRKEIRFTFTVI